MLKVSLYREAFCYSYGMTKDGTPFQILPTTGRSTEALARRHGYRSLASLAQSLPPGAIVLDVGAGVSPLGKEVALLRPDAHWINLDFAYHNQRILEEAKEGAPSNLKLVTGDVTRLNEYVKPNSVDAIFSYFLFPHLSTYNQHTALIAAGQVYAAVKPAGIMVVGPRFRPRLHPASLLGKSWRVTKAGKLTPESYSQEILRQTRLPAFSRYVRRAFNAAVFDVFGTSRYLKGESLVSQQVYEPSTGRYISIYSPAGIHLVGKVLAGTLGLLTSKRQL